eukprot:m.256410 g.256410  ORF g.256410 m.256410 type:complete len:349 (-) comp19171_c4_seq3:99-1145(-)
MMTPTPNGLSDGHGQRRSSCGSPVPSSRQSPKRSSERPPRVYGQREFTPDEHSRIQRALSMNLAGEYLSYKPGFRGGKEVAYITGSKVFELANETFGYNGWSHSIRTLNVDYCEKTPDRKIEAGVTCVVRVELKDGTYREDIGFGTMRAPSKAMVLEKAKKEAVTDALKRSLRTFGNSLGLCMGDKDYLKAMQAEKHSASTRRKRPLRSSDMQVVADASQNVGAFPLSPTTTGGAVMTMGATTTTPVAAAVRSVAARAPPPVFAPDAHTHAAASRVRPQPPPQAQPPQQQAAPAPAARMEITSEEVDLAMACMADIDVDNDDDDDDDAFLEAAEQSDDSARNKRSRVD